MYRITDVVRHLLIINVLVYFAAELFGVSGYLAVYYPSQEVGLFRPYQIVTYMFMHGDISHLFFNMIGLFFFGPPIEMVWGPKRFLFYYFFTGLGALVLHFMVKYIELHYMHAPLDILLIPMVGASGAIFGVLAAYAMLFPNNIIQLLFPPIALKAKYLVLIYAFLELSMGVSNLNAGGGGIAHFAHIGGALSGLLLIIYWRKFGTRL